MSTLKATGFTTAIRNNPIHQDETEKAVTRMRKEGKQSPVNLMMPEHDYKRMKVRIAILGISMKDYVVDLILKDLDSKKEEVKDE